MIGSAGLGLKLAFFSASLNVPFLNMIAAAVGTVALVVYIVTEALNKPLENAIDESSPEVQFYINGINPQKSYWVNCSEDLDDQKKLHAVISSVSVTKDK